ncbi:MAG: hypothetical protein WAK03_12720 [Methylocystis sp.]
MRVLVNGSSLATILKPSLLAVKRISRREGDRRVLAGAGGR